MTAPLTVHEAADITGWSARMLRYLERVGLVVPPRSTAGYRVYRPQELDRLRTLRDLLATYNLGLSDLAFAKRLRDDPELAHAVSAWLEARGQRRWPQSVPANDWLSFEQEKSRRLLAAASHAA